MKNCICVKFEKLSQNDYYSLLEEKLKIFENLEPMLDSIEKTKVFVDENLDKLVLEKTPTIKTFLNVCIERFGKTFDEFQTLDDLAKTIAMHSKSLTVMIEHYCEAVQYTTIYDDVFMVIGAFSDLEKKWVNLTPLEKQKFFEYVGRTDL